MNKEEIKARNEEIRKIIPSFTTDKDLQSKINELNIAKKNCMAILEKDGVLVDFHDLDYWAKRVVTLRKEIKEML